MKVRYCLCLALAFSLGCQAPVPTATRSTPHKAATGASAGTSGSGATNPALRTLPLNELPRLVSQNGTPSELIGKVKLISDNGGGLISDNGGGIISNNSGQLISDNGGGLISDNGGGLISDNGGGLIGKTKYGVLATTRKTADAATRKTAEFLLADAQIEVLDAQGRVLVGADKKPITAVTDKQGNYQFKAVLPGENLIFRIRLFNGGQLFAFVTKDAAGARALNIDTASSLGAAYVLEKYVRKRQDVLDRLPGADAQALTKALEDAKALLAADKAPSYTPEDLVAQTEALRAKAPTLDSTLEEIKAKLLVGLADLGNGMQATKTSLATPVVVLGDGKGNLFIGETSGQRIRRVAADGTISTFAGGGTAATVQDGQTAMETTIAGPTSLAFMPDGSMLVSEGLTPRVRKITPDGKMVTLAGNGTRQAPAALGVKATASTLWSPGQVACGPDGRVYFTEQPRKGQIASRILYVDEQGLLQALPTPPGPEWQSTEFSGLGFAPDGTIWVLNCATAGDPGWLARKKPGADWEIVLRGIDTAVGSKLAIAPDGTVYVSASGANQILRVDPATLKSSVVAGTGQAGFTGDGGPATAAQLNAPDGIWPDASGAIYFVDSGNGLVRKIDPAGVITTVAGATGVTQAGDALSVSINQPGGLALDAQGRLLIAEIASGTIKRLDGQQLSVIAGSTKGFAGDGGPATQARFDAPSGLVYDAAGNLIVVDSANVRIRKIAPDGTVSTIAGKGDSGGMGGKTSVPASEALMRRPTSAAIGPDGLLYWTDNENNLIQRLSKDGATVELVAGAPDYQTSQGDVGDGGPATQAKLSHPFGLAFDKAGNLYFADFGNLRVRKIDTQGVITSVAGLPQAQLLPKLLGGAAPNEEGLDAKQAMLVGPAALCFDAAGNLYVSELGTVNLTSLGSGVGALPIPVELLPKVYARIRKIAPDGKITTVAGPGTKLLNDPSSDNSLKLPTGLVFDAQGRLIVCDAGTNQVKMLPKGAF